ncbi:phage holin family protein [Solibacillus sp. MA9]|uniref:Phage holin family protein n=1 Tax=Solibacillus palustris TaxID=2908203 RepID=A0ABS9UB31_9BACL|nr:phage holin family protein [Solibacillus sp. MA9]MCH7321551.1 phage holin family protein [Solibacillus sp. MA9]
MEANTLWTSAIDEITGWVAYLIGNVDELVTALCILMAIDFTLGIMVAWLIKEVVSRKAFKGLLKKLAMILMVVAAVQLDNATNSGDFMRNAMILFLIGMEGISMIENLGHLGIKVPRFLQNAFTQLQNGEEDKSKDGENK